MRHTFPIAALLSILLAACASKPNVPAKAVVSQSGSLKVHPGLLGQPVPSDLPPQEVKEVIEPAPVAAVKANGIKTDKVSVDKAGAP